MKNTLKYICMMVLVALAVTSCHKTKEEQPRRSTFQATTGYVEFEDLDLNKAYIAPDRKIHFEEGDVVMVFNLSKEHPSQSHCATYETVGEGDTVAFQNCNWGQVAEDPLDGGYFAYYSGNFISGDGIEHYVITELSEGENKCKFFLSPTQTYREDMVSRNALPLVASVDSVQLSDANFTFKSPCGILSLKPYEANPRSVAQIEFVDNSYNLSGWLEFILDEFDCDTMIAAYNSFLISDPQSLEEWKTKVGYQLSGPDMGYSVTLNVDPPVHLGTSKANTPTFNVVLPPLAFYNGGRIIFSFSDGSVKDFVIPLSEINKFIMKPNTLKSIGLNLDNF